MSRDESSFNKYSVNNFDETCLSLTSREQLASKRNTNSNTLMEALCYSLSRLAMNSNLTFIDDFDGESDYRVFVKSVELIGKDNNWSEKQMVSAIEFKLKGLAREFYFTIETSRRPQTFKDMKNWLASVFDKKVNFYEAKNELTKCKRKTNESLGSFMCRLKIIAEKMVTESDPFELSRFVNMLVAQQFVDGLDTRLSNLVRAEGIFLNLDEAFRIASEKEDIFLRLKLTPEKKEFDKNLFEKTSLMTENCERDDRVRDNGKVHILKVKASNDRKIKSKLKNQFCYTCGQKGHYRLNCRFSNCKMCNSTTHTSKNCYFLKKNRRESKLKHKGK
ncbi:uncharacterized protein LOC126265448 [Aethina tumida]|uniref:uncharacterized protein LOC126264184 n=1 Tax=Aethina tumida TaxID=116153 RepID=UPI0021491883|nr:uncharacterized protein LOC126264184 [Aethina tumida]XP_049823000.1 uncharacterized protein LOC126265448 [Aethina tumida]